MIEHEADRLRLGFHAHHGSPLGSIRMGEFQVGLVLCEVELEVPIIFVGHPGSIHDPLQESLAVEGVDPVQGSLGRQDLFVGRVIPDDLLRGESPAFAPEGHGVLRVGKAHRALGQVPQDSYRLHGENDPRIFRAVTTLADLRHGQAEAICRDQPCEPLHGQVQEHAAQGRLGHVPAGCGYSKIQDRPGQVQGRDDRSFGVRRRQEVFGSLEGNGEDARLGLKRAILETESLCALEDLQQFSAGNQDRFLVPLGGQFHRERLVLVRRGEEQPAAACLDLEVSEETHPKDSLESLSASGESFGQIAVQHGASRAPALQARARLLLRRRRVRKRLLP